MKKPRLTKKFLEGIEKYYNVSAVCASLGISRNTIYRWRKEDENFAKEMDTMLNHGRDAISDLAESKMVEAIKDRKSWAIRLWLESNHKNYIKPRSKDFISTIFSDDKKVSKVEIQIYGPREGVKPELNKNSETENPTKVA